MAKAVALGVKTQENPRMLSDPGERTDPGPGVNSVTGGAVAVRRTNRRLPTQPHLLCFSLSADI